MRRCGSFLVLPAALLALAAAAPAAPSASAAQARLCHTATSSITNRHDISCERARQVAERAARAVGLPECDGDPTKHWNGWRIAPHQVGKYGIGARFVKGERSFVVSGGGSCA